MMRSSRSGLLTLALIGGLLTTPGCGGATREPVTGEVDVRFMVTAPADTPAGAAVVLDFGATGAAAPPPLVLDRSAAGHWQGTLAGRAAGDTLRFDLRLTEPAAVEIDSTWSPVAARAMVISPEENDVDITVARWDLPAPAGEAPVTFIVTVPAGTPAGSPIWLSGNHERLGQWNGAGARLTPRADGRFIVRLDLPLGAALEYKVTRGSWDTVEKGPAGEEIANHTHLVEGPATLETTVATWRDQGGGPKPPGLLTGDIRHHRNFTSQYVKPRDLIVYLPPGYADHPEERYPVLYMHDGQNLMDASTAFIGVEWGVDETAQRLILAGRIDPIIIVGLSNTSDRIAEYTPEADAGAGGGRADDYGRCLVEEVKPFIDASYRTQPEAAVTGLCGSSLGGIVSLYLGLSRSDVFTRIGCVSPAAWFADRSIVRIAAATPKKPLKIWEDIGTAEGGNPASIAADARALRDALVSRGWTLEQDLRYVEFAGASHNEAAWAARFDQVLLWLYGR